jgi:hypothetical protein
MALFPKNRTISKLAIWLQPGLHSNVVAGDFCQAPGFRSYMTSAAMLADKKKGGTMAALEVDGSTSADQSYRGSSA